MKISNETKIGALTAIAVTMLILGFDFLKGKSFFKTGNFLYAKYTDTKQLQPSNAVYVNGYQIGSVYEIDPADVNLHNIVVTIKLNENFNIPTNSVASISSSPLGSPSIDIKLGTANSFLKSDDTLMSENSGSLLEGLTNKLQPVADSLQITLHSLNAVLQNFNTVLDPNTKNNLQNVVANLNKTMASFAVSSASLQKMMDSENGSLTQSMNNMSTFTKNLAANNNKIDSTLGNLQTATGKLARADIDGLVNNLKASFDKLSATMTKINSSDGSLGALINDKTLYNNLTATMASLHILMDDLRVHPKRYVNISVFGKKDKGDYLTSPLKTDSTTITK
jgi:phospholipid/cholesterol/gamma-HCH transport system substrate-binding protein